MVPKSNLSEHQKLSKIATLRLAIHYISALTTTLKSTGAAIQPIKPPAGVGDRRGRRRGRGGRKRKLLEPASVGASSCSSHASFRAGDGSYDVSGAFGPPRQGSASASAVSGFRRDKLNRGRNPRSYHHDHSHDHHAKMNSTAVPSCDYSTGHSALDNSGGFSPDVDTSVKAPLNRNAVFVTEGRFYRVASQGSVSPGSLQGGYSSSGSCQGEGSFSPVGYPEGEGAQQSGSPSPRGGDGVDAPNGRSLFLADQFRVGDQVMGATFCVL